MALDIELFNDDGYPTEEVLSRITAWSVKDDVFALLKAVAPLFEGYGRCEYNTDKQLWEVATGGWSGCEDVVQALQQNTLFWSLCWQLSRRGGYYEFTGHAPD